MISYQRIFLKSIVLKFHFQASHFYFGKDVPGSNANSLGPLRKHFCLHSFINIYQMLFPVLGNMGTVGEGIDINLPS